MSRFRKKPVVIDAVRWTGKNQTEMFSFTKTECLEVDFLENTLNFKELESKLPANVGDWIVKGIKGEFYPCEPDIFEMTYEPVEASTT